MRKYEYILFDLDGTLTDSGKGIKHCARYAYKQLGIECPSDTELDTFIGPPLSDSFAAHDVPPYLVDEAVHQFRSLYNEKGKYENEPYPDIKEVLETLKKNGLKLYTATSKPEHTAIEVLQHFKMDPYFEQIAGADEEKITKADVIASVLSSIDRTKAVMIGDTKYDVAGAAENHIPCIGAAWGYGKKEELQDALCIVEKPSDLIKILL